MDRTASVKKAELPPGRRVLAISDIHGNLTFLKALLTAAGYTHEDILVLVGDLVEKGPASLAVLRYVMELSQTHTVYALRGNRAAPQRMGTRPSVLPPLPCHLEGA